MNDRRRRHKQRTSDVEPEPKRPQDAEPVTEQEAEQMFIFWRANKDTIGIKGVAKKFNRSRATIYRIAKRYHWDARDARIGQQVREKSDEGIIKAEVGRERRLHDVVEDLFHRLLPAGAAGPDVRHQSAEFAAQEASCLARRELVRRGA